MRRTILSLFLAASLAPSGGFVLGAEDSPTGFSRWLRNPFGRNKPSTDSKQPAEATAKAKAETESKETQTPVNGPAANAPQAKPSLAAVGDDPPADTNSQDQSAAPPSSPVTQPPRKPVPTVELPTQTTVATETSPAETPVVEAPSGKTPDTEAPVGEIPDSKTPAGEKSSAEKQAAITPPAETRIASVPAAEVAAAESSEAVAVANPPSTSPVALSASPPEAPTATVIPIADPLKRSAIRPIGVGVRIPARAPSSEGLAGAAESPAMAELAESPAASAPVETDAAVAPPAKVEEETLAEVINVDDDVQPVSGDQDTPAAPAAQSARLFRRLPSNRASRVTFRDDESVPAATAPLGYTPPRRVTNSRELPAQPAERPVTTRNGSQAAPPAANQYMPQSAVRSAASRSAAANRVVESAQGSTPPRSTAATRGSTSRSSHPQAAINQPAPTKRGWLFWRGETPANTTAANAPSSSATGTSTLANPAAGARSAPGREGVSPQRESEVAAPVSSRASERRAAQLGLAPGEQLVEERVVSDRVVGESAAAPAKQPAGARTIAPSRGGVAATRGNTPSRSGSVTNGKSKAASQGNSSPRSAAALSDEGDNDVNENATVEIAVPTGSEPKPSISDRMKSFFGGKRE
ncbi:MAG: hypothetical protein ACKO38_03350 [Planctomycetota bacterium]